LLVIHYNVAWIVQVPQVVKSDLVDGSVSDRHSQVEDVLKIGTDEVNKASCVDNLTLVLALLVSFFPLLRLLLAENAGLFGLLGLLRLLGLLFFGRFAFVEALSSIGLAISVLVGLKLLQNIIPVVD
jgi:hypothetical protein